MTSEDIRIIRDLGKQIAEIAARPEQEEKRQLWYAHNSLKPGRPLVLCYPEDGWIELLSENDLTCEGKEARGIELGLRRQIYASEHFLDDAVYDNIYRVPYVVHQTSWGVGSELTASTTERGAYTWEGGIKTKADLEKLQIPTITYDPQETQKHFDYFQNLFGDIMQVQLYGAFWAYCGLIDEWANLRGLNQVYVDMGEDPEIVHAGMEWLMEGTLAKLESVEAQGLLALNNGNDYLGSGGRGFCHELPSPGFDGHVRPIDLWGFADAQNMAPVSPTMHDEFVLRYQAPILERFGLNAYGCCEPLHLKLELLKRRVPRLRWVSISPWADKRVSAEKLGSDYIYSWKPNPAYLAGVDFDGEFIRRDIRETIGVAKEHSCVLQIVLKDTHTCNHQPWRFDEWVRIAKEESLRGAE